MNRFTCSFSARLENETLARSIVTAFLLPYHPTMDEVMEVKTMVAEGVANAIIHGYDNDPGKEVQLELEIDDHGVLAIRITDQGIGIEDIALAMTPLYTSKAHLERSGMGFTIMESFADEFEVQSTVGGGTSISMKKRLQFAHEHG